MEGTPDPENELRKLAILRLKKRRDFAAHLMIYVVVNAALIVIWALAGAGYFWPIFVIVGWGIGLGAHAWDVYGRKPITEDEIRRETDRLRSGGGEHI